MIENQVGDRGRPVRRFAPSDSFDDGVRVIRREEIVDLPERRRLSRHGGPIFSEECCIRDDEPYLEDLDRHMYYAASRPPSRERYVEEVEINRSHSRPRNGSHFTFIEHSEEPGYGSSRARRHRRRRSIHFDGADEKEESQDKIRHESPMSMDGADDSTIRGRLKSPIRASRNASKSSRAQRVERATVTGLCPTQRALEPESSPKPMERTNIEPSTQPHKLYDHVRSRSRGRSAQWAERPNKSRRPVGNDHMYNMSPTRPQSQSGSYDPSEPSYSPPRRRRAISQASEFEVSRPNTPIYYRHVHAPSPLPCSPSPREDNLAEMLARIQITPPSEQDSRRNERYAHYTRESSPRDYDYTPPTSAEYDQTMFPWQYGASGERCESDGYGYEPSEGNFFKHGAYDTGLYTQMNEPVIEGEYNWMD